MAKPEKSLFPDEDLPCKKVLNKGQLHFGTVGQ